MTATFDFSETNLVGATVTNSISNVNFGNTDAPNITPASNPVTAGNNSYEKWIRGHFSGTYSSISNLKFYKSAGAYVTGEDIKAAVNASYATPVATTSAVATVTVPTTLGTALVPTAPGASPSYSGYITTQSQTTVSTPPGNVNTKTFTQQNKGEVKFNYIGETLKKYLRQYRGNLLMQRVRRDYTLNLQLV